MTVPSFSSASSASRTGDRLTWNLVARSSSGSQSPGLKTSSRIASRIFLITTVGVFSISLVSLFLFWVDNWRIGKAFPFQSPAATPRESRGLYAIFAYACMAPLGQNYLEELHQF